MFQAMGEGEQGGTGYTTMLEAARQTHRWPPVLREDRSLPDVKLTVSMSTLVAPKIQADLERRFGAGVLHRPRAEQLALATAGFEGTVTNARLRIMAGVDSTVAAAALRRLVADGLLLREGERQQTRYLLAPGLHCRRSASLQPGSRCPTWGALLPR